MPVGLSLLRSLRIATIGVAMVLVLATGYYLNEVRVARKDTSEFVKKAWLDHGRRLRYADLQSHRREVLLAVEDPAFFRHRGVDLETPGAGMTTITQGLVKLMYFPGGFKQGIAKIRQTLIAQYALDALVSKEEQLDLFLNMAYMGSRDGKPVRGFAQAAQAYFGKDFSELSDAEFRSLVAMLIAPNDLAPGTPAHLRRLQRIDAYLSGTSLPSSLLDVEYEGKTHGTRGEEILMGLLRILTDARPSAVEN